MQSRIVGTTMPVLEIALDPNESVISEAGELSWMSASIGMTTHTQLGGGGRVEHMFTGVELTQKGAELMADFVGAVREAVGMDIPLSCDHFGHIGVKSCIKLGRALEKHNVAWLEDKRDSSARGLVETTTD